MMDHQHSAPCLLSSLSGSGQYAADVKPRWAPGECFSQPVVPALQFKFPGAMACDDSAKVTEVSHSLPGGYPPPQTYAYAPPVMMDAASLPPMLYSEAMMAVASTGTLPVVPEYGIEQPSPLSRQNVERHVAFCGQALQPSTAHYPRATQPDHYAARGTQLGRQSALSPRAPAKMKTPQPVSPRRKMSDMLHGQTSVTRFPQQSSSPKTSPRGDTNLRVGNFNRERGNAQESSACILRLKRFQEDSFAEQMVEEMMAGNGGSRHRLHEQRVLREQLKRPANRDANKCASSLAGKTKPPPRSRYDSSRAFN